MDHALEVKRRWSVLSSTPPGTLPATVLVVVLATINFLLGIAQPAHLVWDERYYVTTAQRYEDGTAQFASHPPLGLMLIAAGDALLHPNRGTDTRAIAWDKLYVFENAFIAHFRAAHLDAFQLAFALAAVLAN